MLQYRQASLTTPTNAIELTKVDLEQVSGCGFGGGFDGLGFGGFDGLGFGGFSPLGLGGFGGFGGGFGGGFDGFGSGNTILINVDSANKKRDNQRRKYNKHDKY